MGKRIISVLLIVGICLFVTACSPVENLFDIMNRVTDNDNPLSGKSTDERINQNDAAITLAHIQNILFQQ